MMNKQIIIKEITECGFYCSKDDTERLYLYEVIKNTDEEWLKENPEATLLIDEWIYDHTDYDDRKVYGTSGNLTAVCNDSTNCKVYKIEDTEYKIYGNCGQFLIEDKPTYKEQLKRKEQECETLSSQLDFEVQKKECLEQKCKQQSWDIGNLGYKIKNQRHEINNRLKQLDYLKAYNKQLEKENLHYRNQFAMQYMSITVDGKEDYCGPVKRLEKALQEIKEIASKVLLNTHDLEQFKDADALFGALLEIHKKISEVENG